MPEGAVYVGRPSQWSNPYRVADYGREIAVELYRAELMLDPELQAEARRVLRGRPLVYWCRLDEACHADVLLEVANA